MPGPRLSLVVIARDEVERIAACLDSVPWADERLVLDSGSRDGTQALCRAHGARVVETDWPGFGAQKNRALDLARGDWILNLDADECLSPALAAEIQACIARPGPDAYWLPRRSHYLGRVMRFGDWRGDRVLRLFRRGHARFSDDLVHERLVVEGSVGVLHAPVLHYPFDDLEQVLDKLNRYSTLSARQRLQRGETAGLAKALTHGGWTFLRGYLLRGGFLDGREGFLLALSNGLGTFYRYAKMTTTAQRGPI